MDIKVNAAEWVSLGIEEQKRVESIIGTFFKGDRIVPDPTTPRSTAPHIAAAANPLCTAACGVAEAAAVAACAGLGNPIAIAACVAAAHAAGDFCRSKC